jgi:hypothetical protein
MIYTLSFNIQTVADPASLLDALQVFAEALVEDLEPDEDFYGAIVPAKLDSESVTVTTRGELSKL